MQGVPLPFPAKGHVVVDWGKERVLAAAVPEEVRRRLEEHWVRRPVVPLRGPLVLGKDTSQLRRLAERYGGVEVYGVGYRDSSGRLSALSAVLELRPSRPLAREELRALLEEVLLLHESPRFADILALADLWALAMGAPSVYWGAWESLWESFSVPSASGRAREVETIPLPLTGWLGRLRPTCLSFEVDGSRGRAALSLDSLDIVVPKLDDELLARLEEVEEALETFKGALDRWDGLLGSLAAACGAALSELGADAPSIVREALAERERPGAKVWEEGGRVKLWLAPWLRGLLAARLKRVGLTPADYLRKVSEKLGREVELVGEEPPFRFSPRLDAAYARLVEAMERLVGAPRAANGGTGAQQAFS